VKPTVNVLYFPGTNCHAETVRAFERVGARAELVFASDVVAGRARLDGADILCLPGGFSFGDHVGAGVIAGLLVHTRMAEQYAACRRRPIIAICNGFQIAVQLGAFGPGVALEANDSGTFRNVPHQPHRVLDNPSPWLRGLSGETLRFPCAHGEGRFTFLDRSGWLPALAYPPGENPDGSTDDIAGVTTPDGLVLGLMNHPERSQDDAPFAIFENGVLATR
jgi:phosphoribosylformylglycinamidine synthase subunit PurQ / glutaminase